MEKLPSLPSSAESVHSEDRDLCAGALGLESPLQQSLDFCTCPSEIGSLRQPTPHAKRESGERPPCLDWVEVVQKEIQDYQGGDYTGSKVKPMMLDQVCFSCGSGAVRFLTAAELQTYSLSRQSKSIKAWHPSNVLALALAA